MATVFKKQDIIKNQESEEKRCINMLVEYLGYKEINAFLDQYELIVKDLINNEIYNVKYMKSKKAPLIKDFLFNKDSSLYLVKGDIIVLDKCHINTKTKYGICNWITTLRNEGKRKDTDDVIILPTLTRFKSVIDKNADGSMQYFVVECLMKDNFTLNTDDFNDSYELSYVLAEQFMKRIKEQKKDRIYMLVNSDIYVYPILIKDGETEDGGISYSYDYDVEKLAKRIFEINGSYFNLLLVKKCYNFNIRFVKQFFSGNRFKEKLNTVYERKLNKLEDNFKSDEFKNRFLKSIVVLREREDGSKYFTYFEIYNEGNKEENVIYV